MGKYFPVRALRIAYLGSLVLGVLLVALGGLIESAAYGYASPQQQAGGHVDVATFKLPITPISAQYYARVLQAAQDDGATALVIQLDTPGGLVESMEDMKQRTLASRVPVVAYVSPQGAMAASAGIFVVYASHVAAMAPNTTIGSAEVLLNAGESGSDSSTPESGDAAALRRKVTNELVSEIRTLANHRNRNADFGEKAIRQSANL